MNDDIPTIVEGALLAPAPARKRWWVLYAGLLVVVALLTARSLYLQVMRGDAFRVTAEDNRIALLPVPAPRGVFYDTFEHPLVENIASTDLLLDPTLLPNVEDEAYLPDRLPQLVADVTSEDVQTALQQARERQRVVVLKKALTHDEVLALEAEEREVRGTRLASSLVRKYLTGDVMGHVLGYTGAASARELEADETLLPIDSTGKTGIEQTYDVSLRGRPGFSYAEVNASGRPQKDLGREEPVPGENVSLEIDIELQEFIVRLFKESEYRAGAVVAVDPRSGAVRALVSFPTFDPNVFSQPSQSGQAQQFFADEATPLFNRAVDGTYPPGSVIKPFIALGALQASVITSDTAVLSTGGLRVGAWNFPDWKAGGHGITNVKKAIAESVNTFFYKTTEELGVEATTGYLRKLGWGQMTGVDLPSEAEGFLPSEDWKVEAKGERWYIGDTYHLGIGQGDVLVTPLQVAAATAALANGSSYFTPHIAQAESDAYALEFDAAHIQTVREGMRQTVTDGSGIRLRTLPVALAGKTGTAQVGGGDDTHAWFTSFGPYESPELAVTVLLERGGQGDKNAVPFAEEIWKWWLSNRYDKL